MMSLLGVDSPTMSSKSDQQLPSEQDPFISQNTSTNHYRFSRFDNQLFALNPQASPGQAKKALEAHLAETERRIQDASRLGTSLLQQRKELAGRLEDVEKQQAEDHITPELRSKLVELEKEYNDVGRESARAFLSKSRVSGANELGAGGLTFGGDFKRPVSPSKENFETLGMGSPSKINVLNRRQRNQPSNRIHDIEFATEISTSLLSQVRHLQALLAEKEEYIKTVASEKSRLEVEVEGLGERLRSLNESGERYKDENWSLETQIHEFIAKEKEAADRERRLIQNLNIVQAEKSAAQKDLDEIKLVHAKLSDDHIAALKQCDIELTSTRRNLAMIESEKGTLQRKCDELLSQNKELAKSVVQHRGKFEDLDKDKSLIEDELEVAPDDLTPEHSPPPSPVKGTPRHTMLESETLKSSLQHAHRMIQNLKGTIHREKTEKLELKRLLQDARDELELRRGDIVSSSGKKNRKVEPRVSKKQFKIGQLGGIRNSTSEVCTDDLNWEDDENSPRTEIFADMHSSQLYKSSDHNSGKSTIDTSTGASDYFESANDQENSDAFETAYEGYFGSNGSHHNPEDTSDNLTETEDRKTNNISIRSKSNCTALLEPGNRQSFQSTASISDDEYDNINDDTLILNSIQPSRLRLKVGRGGYRRSRTLSEQRYSYGSPMSHTTTSRDGTPRKIGQSLFAELGEMVESGDGDSILGSATTSRFASRSTTPTSRPRTASKNVPASLDNVSHFPMIDSSTMTELFDLPIDGSLSLSSGSQTSKSTQIDSVAPMIDAWSQWSVCESLVEVKFVDASCQYSNLLPEEISPVNTAYVNSSCQWSEEEISKNSNMINASSQWLEVDSLVTATQVNNLCQYSKREKHEKSENLNVTNKLFEEKNLTIIRKVDASSQWYEQENTANVNNEKPKLVPTPIYNDMGLQCDIAPDDMEEKPLRPSEPPILSPVSKGVILNNHLDSEKLQITISRIISEELKPVVPINSNAPISKNIPERNLSPFPQSLVISPIQYLETVPFEPQSKTEVAPDVLQIPFEGRNIPNLELKTFKALSSTFIQTDSSPSLSSSNQLLMPNKYLSTDELSELQPLSEELTDNLFYQISKSLQTADESSQTALTANQIEELLRNKKKNSLIDLDCRTSSSPRLSQFVIKNSLQPRESLQSTDQDKVVLENLDLEISENPLTNTKGADSCNFSNPSGRLKSSIELNNIVTIAPGTAVVKHDSSSPEITAVMGPPPLPVNPAHRSNQSHRPRTPKFHLPSNSPLKDGTTPRPMYSFGALPAQTPCRNMRSRVSSVSSFASEVETRFQMQNGQSISAGIQSGTDPRMINAITQTMIGEYLWKYTRKTGRGAMSEKRHRRYFWVHPYTKTLYWSNRDPSSAGRAELKAKSVPIEAVRVVTDDNPMPPGLHRKSLIILTPSRAVKFTATTGQRHETWFNSLSYLLLRTGEDTFENGTEIVNGSVTLEDIAEFNSKRSGNTPAVIASLSSYNSRTTRNDSPEKNAHIFNSKSSRLSGGTFSRLSNYLKPGKDGYNDSTSSRYGKCSMEKVESLYQASQVHDSADDLRELIEKQDRESDKLENVRACCDGRHDVGHLHNSTKSRYVKSMGITSSGSSKVNSSGIRYDTRTK